MGTTRSERRGRKPRLQTTKTARSAVLSTGAAVGAAAPTTPGAVRT
jgi:hypothetical protein